MDLGFLSPVSALVGLAVFVPLGATLLRERRARSVRTAIGLAEPPLHSQLPAAIALIASFALLAAAAAQPVVRMKSTARLRTDAQAYVLVDITRSMLASSEPDSPRRIARAIETAIELRRALPDVPFGVATLTNRSLPHLFPTADRDQFELVMRGAVGINRPPGTEKQLFAVSTDFQSLEAIATDNFFSPDARKRLVIMLSDGESHLFPVRRVVTRLGTGGVDLVAMRFWDRDERVWKPDGTAEAAYEADPLAVGFYEELAALTTGGRVYGEDELGDAVAAARTYLGSGPVVEVPAPGRTVSLAPWAVIAACFPLAALVVPGLRRRSALPVGPRPGPPSAGFAYSMLPRWHASSRRPGSPSRATRAPLPRSLSGPRSSTGASSPAGD
jgi:hypothetical protein